MLHDTCTKYNKLWDPLRTPHTLFTTYIYFEVQYTTAVLIFTTCLISYCTPSRWSGLTRPVQYYTPEYSIIPYAIVVDRTNKRCFPIPEYDDCLQVAPGKNKPKSWVQVGVVCTASHSSSLFQPSQHKNMFTPRKTTLTPLRRYKNTIRRHPILRRGFLSSVKLAPPRANNNAQGLKLSYIKPSY